MRVTQELPDRQRRAAHKLVLCGGQRVAERSQAGPAAVSVKTVSFSRGSRVFERSPRSANQRLDQLASRLKGARPRVAVPLRLLLALEPRVDARLDVALEDLGEVVVAVELVLVGDASEGLNGSRGQPWSIDVRQAHTAAST